MVEQRRLTRRAMAFVLAGGRDAAEQVCDLGKLRRAWGDAREGVGGVVDDDRDGELVEVGRARERGRAHPLGHASDDEARPHQEQLDPAAVKRVGEPVLVDDVSPDELQRAWDYLQNAVRG